MALGSTIFWFVPFSAFWSLRYFARWLTSMKWIFISPPVTSSAAHDQLFKAEMDEELMNLGDLFWNNELFYKSSLWPLSVLTVAVKDCLMGVSQLMISANYSLLILSNPALSDCCYFFHVQAGPWQAVGLVNGGRLMVHFVRFRVGGLFNNVGLNHHQLTNMQQTLFTVSFILLFHQQISGT